MSRHHFEHCHHSRNMYTYDYIIHSCMPYHSMPYMSSTYYIQAFQVAPQQVHFTYLPRFCDHVCELRNLRTDSAFPSCFISCLACNVYRYIQFAHTVPMKIGQGFDNNLQNATYQGSDILLRVCIKYSRFCFFMDVFFFGLANPLFSTLIT